MSHIQSRNVPTDTLLQIRSHIFAATKVAGLVDSRSDIVSRRGMSLTLLSDKLTDDIWSLDNCLNNKRPVKRTMLRMVNEVLTILKGPCPHFESKRLTNDCAISV